MNEKRGYVCRQDEDIECKDRVRVVQVHCVGMGQEWTKYARSEKRRIKIIKVKLEQVKWGLIESI